MTSTAVPRSATVSWRMVSCATGASILLQVRGGSATVCEGWGVRAGLAGEDGLHGEGTLHGSSLSDLPWRPHQRHEADGDGALLNDAGWCPRNEQDFLIGDAYGNDHAPADAELIH